MRYEYLLDMHLPEYDRSIRIKFNSRAEVFSAWSGVSSVLKETKALMITKTFTDDGCNSLINSTVEVLKND